MPVPPISRGLLLGILLIGIALQVPPALAAGSLTPAVKVLRHANIYVSPEVYPAASSRTRAIGQIRAAIHDPMKQGLPERVAVLPNGNLATVANSLRNILGFSGVLIVAGPAGMGVATDRLSAAEVGTIVGRFGALCHVSASRCAARAAAYSLVLAVADDDRLRHNEVIVSIVVFLVLASGIAFLIWWMGRKRREFLASP